MAKQKIAREVLEATAELSRKAYDELLDYFGYGADAEEITSELDNLSPQTRNLIRALEREDYLGFETPDQALKQFIEDPVKTIENYDVSPQLKSALTKFANNPPSKPAKNIDDVNPRIGGRVFETPDGYTWYEQPDGSFLDNADPDKADLGYDSFEQAKEWWGDDFVQQGDEVGRKRSEKQNLDVDEWVEGNKPTDAQLEQQALNSESEFARTRRLVNQLDEKTRKAYDFSLSRANYHQANANRASMELQSTVITPERRAYLEKELEHERYMADTLLEESQAYLKPKLASKSVSQALTEKPDPVKNYWTSIGVDELVNRGFPREVAERINSGELPMDYESRMQRAREQGYDVEFPVYHGTVADIKEINPDIRGSRTGASSADKATWAAKSPTTAQAYADMAAASDIDEALYKGKQWVEEDYPEYMMEEYGFDPYASFESREQEWPANQTIYPLLYKKDATRFDMGGNEYRPGIFEDVHPVLDQGGRVRLDNFSDLPQTLEGPIYDFTTHVAETDPNSIRSVNAAFDPKYTGPSLLGSLLGGSLLTGLTAGYSEDADAMLTKQMLEDALRLGIDEFTPPGGASLSTGLFDRGAGVKAQDNLFGVMTAENPNRTALTDAENIERTRELGNNLIDRLGEENVTLVKGMYDNPERSFIIENQSPLEVAKLGRDYGQESVFTNKGLILTGEDDLGYMHPIKPTILPHTKTEDWRGTINPDATNYYTEAKSDGLPQYGIPGRTEKIQYDIDWGEKIRIPNIGEPRTPASAKGVHYSTTEGLTELDPGYFGTGAAGAEKARVEAGAAPRTMFYLGDEELTPESLVKSIAPNRYNARLENMYDQATDPQGINAFSDSATEFEKNVDAMGYDGYLSTSMADPDAGRTGTAVRTVPTAVAAATAAAAAKAEEGPGSAAFNERLDEAKYERALRDVAQMQALTAYQSPYETAKRYPGGQVGSIEAPQTSYRELLARGGDALQNIEYPIIGEPFSATGNILHDMAYMDQPDVMDAIFAPLEMAGVVTAPLKYGLLNAYGGDEIAKNALLEMLIKQGAR